MSVDLLMVLVLFGTLILGLPVAFALGIASTVGIVFGLSLFDLSTMGINTYNSIAKYPLIAIPLFILTGTLFERSGVAAALVRFIQVLVGPRKGGLAIVAILVCMILGGMSGSGPADAAAVALVMIPSMTRAGYNKGFSAALIAAGSSTAILIPPSIALILYSIYVPGVDLRALFAAGLIPGLLAGLFLMVPAVLVSRKNNWEKQAVKSSTFKESFLEAIPALIAPIIILGGLRSGLFTPTEAAVVAATYGVFIGCFVYKNIKFRELGPILIEAATTTGAIFLILGTAGVFAWVGTSLGTFERLAHVLISVSDTKWIVLLCIMLLILIAGMFLDAVSIFLILIPVLAPIMHHYEWNPVWFGLLMTVNIAIGQFTPPVAINLMVTSKVAQIGLEKTIGWSLYFILAMACLLALIAIFPEIVLWLPKALGYNVN